MIRRVQFLLDTLCSTAASLASCLCVVLVLVTVLDVLLRYFFQAGSVAVQEAEWHLFGMILMLGIAKTYQDDEHVRVDVVYSRLSQRGQALINIFGIFLFLIPLCALIIWSSLPFVEAAYRLGEQSADPGGLPHRFLIKAMIPFGFVLLLLQAIPNLIRAFGVLGAKEESE